MYYNPIFWHKQGNKLIHTITGRVIILSGKSKGIRFMGKMRHIYLNGRKVNINDKPRKPRAEA